jgi:hypothetical protein
MRSYTKISRQIPILGSDWTTIRHTLNEVLRAFLTAGIALRDSPRGELPAGNLGTENPQPEAQPRGESLIMASSLNLTDTMHPTYINVIDPK